MTEYVTVWKDHEPTKLHWGVPVVRCMDCKWFTPEQTWGEDRGLGMVEFFTDPSDCGNPERCSHHYDSLTGQMVPVHIVTDADGFCAWGERRDDE